MDGVVNEYIKLIEAESVGYFYTDEDMCKINKNQILNFIANG